MNKIIQVTTYGIKSIENHITINFANKTLSGGVNKVSNVKGIYGYNGSGKTALITALDIYQNIVLNRSYLVQNETRELLDKLINFKKKHFYISCMFEYEKNKAIKHEIILKKDKLTNEYIIDEEKLCVSTKRTISEDFECIICKKQDKFSSEKYEDDSTFLNLKKADCTTHSILYQAILSILKTEKEQLSVFENYIVEQFKNILNIEVYLLSQDIHRNVHFNVKDMAEKLQKISQNQIDDDFEIYLDEDTIDINNIGEYEKINADLEKFIKIFIPELKKIALKKDKAKAIYHIRRVFVYNDYSVELEYESSGIKQLVQLFSYFKKCSDGKIVFIDEMDVNINSVYLNKLLEYFANYGKGQLIFTTHNLETMDVLKKYSKAIVALGCDGNLDTWVLKGNRSPKKDYINGYFEHSPMNVEDFDFINVFQGES